MDEHDIEDDSSRRGDDHGGGIQLEVLVDAALHALVDEHCRQRPHDQDRDDR